MSSFLQQITQDDTNFNEEEKDIAKQVAVEKMKKITNRALFCFLFTVSLFAMFQVNFPTNDSINAAIIKASQVSQTNLLISGKQLDAQQMLDILNAARETAKQLTITMWGYTHTPQEWVVILKKISPEYLGPILEVITKILKMFYNLGCAGSDIMKDSYGVVMELSEGNVPLMELARLQGYSNLFSAMTPFFAGFGLAYGSTDAVYKGVLGESILGTITRVTSSAATACGNTTLALLDMCMAVVLDTTGISGEDWQESQESLGFSQSQPISEFSVSESSMYGDVDGISKLANALSRQFTKDEISLELSRISTKSRESVQTFITAQSEADTVIENPRKGNDTIAQELSGLLGKTRENIMNLLNRSSETLVKTMEILFHSNSCNEEPSSSYNEETQFSDISAITMATTCDPLMSISNVAESVEIEGAIGLMKEYDVKHGMTTRSKRQRTEGGKKMKRNSKQNTKRKTKRNTKRKTGKGKNGKRRITKKQRKN